MKIFKVGDTQTVLCNLCRSCENVTFQLKDVPFSDGTGIVKQVLVGVCDQCGNVAVVPHQSTPMIKKALDVQRKSLESRVPAHMIDILNLASSELGGAPDFVPSLIKYYLHSLAADQEAAQDIPRLLQSDLAQGKSEKRLSLKGRHVIQNIDTLKISTKITSTTALLKGIVLKINDDVLVQRNPAHIRRLKSIIAAIS
ncbi:hypothetical protein B4923_07575 [Brenneria roseae subsp. americana]|uniref:Uncharacterized protein n=1 Tax=Brenneria roseae subsp. americana TaxID=1508507 RepID=A0A2U1TUJ0_9GAMM|nr:hypothetical protein [Brenneria roseae]PWC13085.1 hypothetical protein B4923_07575 [Brenneria roseae subsp. americana]